MILSLQTHISRAYAGLIYNTTYVGKGGPRLPRDVGGRYHFHGLVCLYSKYLLYTNISFLFVVTFEPPKLLELEAILLRYIFSSFPCLS